jgi:hypothetical protein
VPPGQSLIGRKSVLLFREFSESGLPATYSSYLCALKWLLKYFKLKEEIYIKRETREGDNINEKECFDFPALVESSPAKSQYGKVAKSSASIAHSATNPEYL